MSKPSWIEAASRTVLWCARGPQGLELRLQSFSRWTNRAWALIAAAHERAPDVLLQGLGRVQESHILPEVRPQIGVDRVTGLPFLKGL